MKLFGESRSSIQRDHAMIAPDSHVVSRLPGWNGIEGVIHITPDLGAGFSQYLALPNKGQQAGSVAEGLQRFIYVETGTATVAIEESERQLDAGHYAWLPPDIDSSLTANSDCRLIVFDKPYLYVADLEAPAAFFGLVADQVGEPFMGDPDAVLRTLLPTDESFDMAVNVFTFQPGTTLPMVEVHVMEHGLQMIAGCGVYRLGERWYPVTQGDVIWMDAFCPQWFVAMGKQPAAYIYYKDVNRDPFC